MWSSARARRALFHSTPPPAGKHLPKAPILTIGFEGGKQPDGWTGRTAMKKGGGGCSLRSCLFPPAFSPPSPFPSSTASFRPNTGCFSGLPAASSGGVRACLRRLAGCAHPTSSAGQAARGEKANAERTANPDYPRGADHSALRRVCGGHSARGRGRRATTAGSPLSMRMLCSPRVKGVPRLARLLHAVALGGAAETAKRER
jgi:hypothetical protein